MTYRAFTKRLTAKVAGPRPEYISGTQFAVSCGSSNFYQYDPTPVVACDAVFNANFHGDNTGSNPVADAKNPRVLYRKSLIRFSFDSVQTGARIPAIPVFGRATRIGRQAKSRSASPPLALQD